MILVFKKRSLRKEEIQQLADTFCTDLESDVEPYEDSESEYPESEHSSSESDLEPPKKLEERTDNFLLALTITQNIQATLASLVATSLWLTTRSLHYWSSNKSLGSEAIKLAISRDRFQLLASELYFNEPKKPDDCSKLYYIEDVVACLKKTYAQVRSESSHQSIDESMAKFKGRSSLKQTGYVYDFDIYSGKDSEANEGTLGEQVVKKLTSTVRESDMSFCFNRFFTSVYLLDTISFAVVGTCISTSKNMPQFEKRKRKRGEYESMHNNNGTIGYLWMTTKEVMVLSICHGNESVEISRNGKDRTKIKLSCPEAIQFYNSHMGGVDLSDQLTSLYEVDRKSMKWWKKVFYKLLFTTAVSAWIIYKELKNKPNMPFLSFRVNLSESLISTGRQNASVIRKRAYCRSSLSARNMINIGDHLPVDTDNMNGPSEFDRSEEVRGTEGTENLNMMKLLADMLKTMENNRISTERMVLEVIKTKNDTEKFHIMPDLSKSIENYDGEIEKGPTAAKVWLEKLVSSATLHSWPPEFILESAKTHLIGAAKSWYNSNIPELNTWENFKDRFEKTFCMEASLY
ncbi:hypothetical protein ILUMI_11590 [Ignelater luminosus]|uniref:PiggyBac transposable element-derived protein domain-containing protein n=1 Tax=Ignelater luminosus TaxID=2038154 RepID=A0A8K0D4P5_IGNLU|nr:hypothetical protein ILUMI_11590 [Ignelater luminosus]